MVKLMKKKAIERIIRSRNPISPLTRERLTQQLLPNLILKNIIDKLISERLLNDEVIEEYNEIIERER